MPAERRPPATWPWVLLALAILAGVSLLAYRNGARYRQAAGWVRHTREVLVTLRDLEETVLEAESARRAFGLTGEAEFKSGYRDAALQVEPLLARARSLTRDNAAQTAHIDALAPAVRRRIAQLDAVLFLPGQDPEPLRAQADRIRAGSRLTTEIRSRITELIAEEERLMAERQQALDRFVAGVNFTYLAGFALSAGILVVSFLLLHREVRERTTAQEEVGRLNAELALRLRQAQEANAELESFSYSVSHDLRAPLRSLDGFSLALLEDHGASLDETAKGHLARIRAAAQRMGELIDALIALSRVSRRELRRETVDLTGLAEQAVAELRKESPARSVAVEVAPGLRAAGDPELLRAALGNLLGNAWKFTAGKGDARIELGADGREAGRRVFFVRDNGAGFDPAYADKLFGAFQRLHAQRDFPGTGIGLATVQRIVRRHGGTVRAEGRPGEGATFFFSLEEAE